MRVKQTYFSEERFLKFFKVLFIPHSANKYYCAYFMLGPRGMKIKLVEGRFLSHFNLAFS